MPSNVVANSNSYVTLAEANSYLDDSLRSGDTWSVLDSDTKKRALISAARTLESMRWQGDPAELEIVSAAAISAGGSGYSEDDVLTVVGGTGVAARVTVTSVSAGVVDGVELLDAGLYSSAPSSPVATSGGGGTGCTLTLTMGDQVLHFPAATVTDRYGDAVDDETVPDAVKEGQIRLAYHYTQDEDLEVSGGTGSNVRSTRAGSASVEFFRPTGAQDGIGSRRFPPDVHELLGQFLSGSGLTSVPYVPGTGVESQFDDDEYTVSEGFA